MHKVKEIFDAEKAAKITANNIDIIEKISEHQSFIIANVDKMVRRVKWPTESRTAERKP